MSEPSDITAPKDPADYRPKPLLGPTFWAMIALCVLCVLAGVAVATVLPRLLAGPTPAPHAAASAAPEATPATATPAFATAALPAPEPAAAPDVARLAARVGILESRQSHVAQAAAAALAAATVAEASQGSGP